MTPPKASYHKAPDFPSSVVREDTIEYGFIGTLLEDLAGHQQLHPR